MKALVFCLNLSTVFLIFAWAVLKVEMHLVTSLQILTSLQEFRARFLKFEQRRRANYLTPSPPKTAKTPNLPTKAMSSSPTTRRANPKISLDWSYLPFLPLQLIARKLPTIADFVRFRCVCSSWRSAAKPADLPPHLPWLMFPSEFSCDGRGGSNDLRGFFSLPDRKIHRLPLPHNHNFEESRCLPFIHGWILIIRTSPNLYIFNPLTRARIPLPPLTAFPGLVFGFDDRRSEKEYGVLHGRRQRRRMSCEQMRDQFIISAVMSANPAASPSSRCVIMVALYSTWKLAFCRPGDAEWTVVDTTFRSRVRSMTCCGNKFYATDGETMAVCDPFASQVKATVIASFEQIFDRRYYWEACSILRSRWTREIQFYLVESAGNVLLVKRYQGNEDGHYRAGWKDHFYVWRCDVNAEEPKWDWASDMGDRALFLCGNHSMSVKASDFSGCRANCIYYDGPFFELDNFSFGDYEVAVFDKKDGSREMIPCYDDSQLDWKKSAWFCPSLC